MFSTKTWSVDVLLNTTLNGTSLWFLKGVKIVQGRVQCMVLFSLDKIDHYDDWVFIWLTFAPFWKKKLLIIRDYMQTTNNYAGMPGQFDSGWMEFYSHLFPRNQKEDVRNGFLRWVVFDFSLCAYNDGGTSI